MKSSPANKKYHSIDFTIHLSLILIIAGIIEGIWGILQLFDIVPSGHPRYPVTGSFYNPGPYCCILASIVPLATYLYFRCGIGIVKYLALSFILIAAILLPGGMSRTGWIAAVAGTAVTAIGLFRRQLMKISRRKLLSVMLCLVAFVSIASFGAYKLKPESAYGRLLIWRISMDAVSSAPLNGVGWQCVAGAYGNAQESFFASGKGSSEDVMTAEPQQYVFNEYLQIAIAFGIPALLLFIALIICTVWLYLRMGCFGLAGVTISLAVTCISSYPFQFIEFRVLSVLVIAGAFSLIKNKPLGLTAAFSCIFLIVILLTRTNEYDINGIYARAQNAMHAGRYEHSNRLLKYLLNYTSDPMVLNFIGKNFENLGQVDSASHYYRRAVNRVPSRHYPHYLLMTLYSRTGQDSLAANEATILLEQTPKVHSLAIEEMRYKAADYIHSFDSKHHDMFTPHVLPVMERATTITPGR